MSGLNLGILRNQLAQQSAGSRARSQMLKSSLSHSSDYFLKVLAGACGLVTLLVGVIVLACRIFHLIKNPDSAMGTMRANAALCFILTGLSCLITAFKGIMPY